MLSLLFATAIAGGWRTLETEHFRVHHPVEATEYAEMVSRHMEEARQRTQEIVGRTESRVVDIYVRDPYATANGMALSFRRRPKMVLWATPPTSSSQLSNYRDVVEDLVVHEDLHLVHLLTPPRGGFRSLVWNTVGVGPIVVAAPDWITEGYATMVEGQLTGAGRPNADFRAAFLRVMAQEGRLPSYDQLSGSSRWNGGGYPYLLGSAYLEWLVERTDADAMKRLWRRMSARKNRSFEENFEGVFGEEPEVLYQRFCAEVTVAALAVETDVEEHVFLELEGWTGAPDVSPNGMKLAFMVETDNPSRRVLRVVRPVPDEKALERKVERRAEVLREDPEDVEPIDPPAQTYKVLDERINDLAPANEPRWINNNDLLFEALVPTTDGRMTTDLFVWELVDDRERRITRRAGVRSADPAPDGTWAVAVQSDWGATRLVRVDLASGAIEPITPYAVDRVVDAPRLSPDGTRIVYLEQAPGIPFRPVLLNLDTLERTPIELDAGVRVADPEWSGSNAVVFGVGRGGALEIVRHDLPTGEWTTLTSTDGVALHPTFTTDTLYHLRLHADGYAIDKRPLAAVKDPVLGGVAPIATPVPPSNVPAPTGSGQVPTSTRYGVGTLEFLPLLGGGRTEGERQLEAGFRLGDAIGRVEGIVLGSYGGGKGVSGVGTAWEWRPRTATVQVHGSATWKSQGVGLATGLTADAGRRRGGWAWGGRLGVHVVSLDDTVVPVSTARVQIGVVSRNAWASLGVVGRAVQSAATGGFSHEVEPRVALGRGGLSGSWRIGQRGDAWPARLGGLPSGLVNEDLQWAFVGGPGWGSATGLGGTTRFEDRRVQVGDAAAVLLQNVRLDNGTDRLDGTMLALVSNVTLSAQALGRVPKTKVGLGVGCVITPLEGPRDRRPCQELSDGVFWGQLRMGL